MLVCVSVYPACQQQSGAVGCSVVGEAHSDPILRQLVRVGSAHDVVSFNLCVGDLQGSAREDSGVLIRAPHLLCCTAEVSDSGPQATFSPQC